MLKPKARHLSTAKKNPQRRPKRALDGRANQKFPGKKKGDAPEGWVRFHVVSVKKKGQAGAGAEGPT